MLKLQPWNFFLGSAFSMLKLQPWNFRPLNVENGRTVMAQWIETSEPIGKDSFTPFNIEKAQNWFQHWESASQKIFTPKLVSTLRKRFPDDVSIHWVPPVWIFFDPSQNHCEEQWKGNKQLVRNEQQIINYTRSIGIITSILSDLRKKWSEYSGWVYLGM